MLYTAFEIVGWLLFAFLLGLLLGLLLRGGRSIVTKREWEIAQAQLKQADVDRASFANERLQLTADLDARTRQVTELETSKRSLETQARQAQARAAELEDAKVAAEAAARPEVAETVRIDASKIQLPILVDLEPGASIEAAIAEDPAPNTPKTSEQAGHHDADFADDEIDPDDLASVEVSGLVDADAIGPSASTSAQVEDLLARLAATQQEADRVSALEARIEELTLASVDAEATATADSSNRISELEAEVGELRGRLNQASAVEGRLADLEVEAGRVAGLEAQLDSLRAERDAQLEAQSPVDEVGATLRELERELELARIESANELLSLQQRVADLQADAERVHEIEAELEDARAAAAEREEQLETARRAAIHQEQLLQAARRLADEHQHDLQVARGEAAGFRAQLDAANARAAELEAELEQLQDDGRPHLTPAEPISNGCRPRPHSSIRPLPTSMPEPVPSSCWGASTSSNASSPMPSRTTNNPPPSSPRCSRCGPTRIALPISKPKQPNFASLRPRCPTSNNA